jgi:hypothetical protein
MSKAAILVLIIGVALGLASDRYFAAKRLSSKVASQPSISETGGLQNSTVRKPLKRKSIDRPPAAIESPKAAPAPLAPPTEIISAGADCGATPEGEKIVGFTGYRKSLPQLCPEEMTGTRQYVLDEMKAFVCAGGKMQPVGGSRFKAAGFDDSGCRVNDEEAESLGDSAALLDQPANQSESNSDTLIN